MEKKKQTILFLRPHRLESPEMYLRYNPTRGKAWTSLLPVVQMLSFDPPPVVFPHDAECKRLFSQSTGRAAAHLGQKKVGSGGAWFIEPEADAREREKEEKGGWQHVLTPPRSHNPLEFAYFSTRSHR